MTMLLGFGYFGVQLAGPTAREPFGVEAVPATGSGAVAGGR